MTNYRNNNMTQCPCRGAAPVAPRVEKGCGCGRPAEVRPQNVPVMVYVVEQEWGCVYSPERALCQGTLFPSLDKPFFGKGGCCCE